MRHGEGPGPQLTSAQHLELQRLIAAGETHPAAAAAVGCATKAVQQLLIRTGGLAPRHRPRSALRLSLGEREEISRGLQAGESCRAIAARLTRAASTVSREVVQAGGAAHYRAWRADEAAVRRSRRPKVAKLTRCPRLRAVVALAQKALVAAADRPSAGARLSR